MCRIFRAGNNYIAALNMPAQDDLCAAPFLCGHAGGVSPGHSRAAPAQVWPDHL